MKILSPCKINLFLHIVGRRENGYHELESLFYPLANPYDVLTINEVERGGFSVKCETVGIDLEDNTLTKAYYLFKERTGFSLGLDVELIKNVPHGAGLGGGSADAATVIKYMYAKWRGVEYSDSISLENEDFSLLNEIATKVGADVPFFLKNTPAYVEGIGEKLSEIDISFLKGYSLLLISPKIKVDTISIFKKFRQENQVIEKKVEKSALKMLTSISNRAIRPHDATINALFRNDLEQCVFSSFPALGKYKEKLLAFEAEIALMSGSGSSLFGLFSKREQAENAKVFFEKDKGVDVFPVVEL